MQNPLNPFPCYQQLRQEYPVYYATEFHCWFITRYDDVLYVIDHPELFSSEQSLRKRQQTRETQSAKTLLWTDPPRHRQLRSLISQAFTPRTIANLAPRINTIVEERISTIIKQREMDIIQDLANPLPILIIAELLGIPGTDQKQFKAWSDIIVSPARQAKKQAVNEMNSYCLNIIMQRQQEPQNDLISALLAAQDQDGQLSIPEILSFCRLLLVAGHETSTNLIGNSLFTLSEYPDLLEEVATNLSLLPGAIEEILRYRTPIQRLRRAATQDITLHGHLIKQGEIVAPILGAANRDEKHFVEPETFIMQREPNRHLGYGHGIHFCIGSALARLETRIALEVLFTHCKKLRRKEGYHPEPVASAFVYGVKQLPLSFEAS